MFLSTFAIADWQLLKAYLNLYCYSHEIHLMIRNSTVRHKAS